MKKRLGYLELSAIALAVLLVLSLQACNKGQQTTAPPPTVPVVEIERTDVPVMEEFIGQIYGFQDIAIRARVEGFLEGIHFTEGSRVSKGQLLYTIDPQQFQARVAAQMSGLAEAKTMLAKAESDLNRIRPLAENNAVSQRDLDAAVAQFEASQAGVEAAKANLESSQIELSYTQIKSPINGIIGKTQAKIGDFVGRSPNPVVLNEVSNVETVLVEFFLNESQYLTLAKELIQQEGEIKKRATGQQAAVNMVLADGIEYPHSGYINFMDRGVNPSTGSLLIQAAFPNPDRILRPGQFARVIVEMNILENAMLIPQQAVNEIQGNFSVFVVGDSSKVENQPVAVAMAYKDYYVIDEGLKGNEQIILEGLQQVRSGMAIKPELTQYQSKNNHTK
jgi:membrane fusion protein (multidrug efflux system)